MKHIIIKFLDKVGNFISLFKKKNTSPNINSTRFTYWVNHIHDQTATWSNKALMWANVHGFEQDNADGHYYWVGIDVRSFGIRVCDHIIKCKNKSTYDEYIREADSNTPNVMYKMRSDPRIDYHSGDHINTEFLFKWGDEEKLFDIHLSGDHCGWEK